MTEVLDLESVARACEADIDRTMYGASWEELACLKKLLDSAEYQRLKVAVARGRFEKSPVADSTAEIPAVAGPPVLDKVSKALTALADFETWLGESRARAAEATQ